LSSSHPTTLLQQTKDPPFTCGNSASAVELPTRQDENPEPLPILLFVLLKKKTKKNAKNCNKNLLFCTIPG